MSNSITFDSYVFDKLSVLVTASNPQNNIIGYMSLINKKINCIVVAEAKIIYTWSRGMRPLSILQHGLFQLFVCALFSFLFSLKLLFTASQKYVYKCILSSSSFFSFCFNVC